ncbi:hypothetical protein GGR52DRAFT_584455 [Hypoxylon sp. FL1284]|nr:hypothetical protein GGR52DRAFT_584455 [Hypoxylon sp. FL1284]
MSDNADSSEAEIDKALRRTTRRDIEEGAVDFSGTSSNPYTFDFSSNGTRPVYIEKSGGLFKNKGRHYNNRHRHNTDYYGTPTPRGFAIPTSRQVESELFEATNAFGNELQPYAPQPTFPQSVHPTQFNYGQSRGRGVTPTPPQMGYPMRFNEGSRPSTAMGGPTGNAPRFNNGHMSSSGAPNLVPGEEEALQMSRIIQARIMTCIQFVQRLPSVPANTATQHLRLCQEISQLLNSLVYNLRNERDEAVRDRATLQQRYQTEMATLTSAGAEQENLRKRLDHSLDRERSAKKEIHDWKARVESLTGSLNSLESKAEKFQEHHAKVTHDWEKQDKQSYKRIQTLEKQVEMLRARVISFAQKAGVSSEDAFKARSSALPTPTLPPVGRTSKPSLDQEIKDDLIARLINPSEGSKSFKPNPQAPAWQPPVSAKSLNRYSTPTPQPGSAVGGPSNWPVVVGAGREVDQYSVTPSNSSMSDASRDRRPQPPVQAPKQDPKPADKASRPTTIAREKEKWNVQDIRDAVEHLYTMTRGCIISCHLKPDDEPRVSYDNVESDEHPTWTYLISLVYPDPQQATVHMRYLLSVEAYRQHVLVRMVLDYIFKKMMSPRIFLGISSETDKHLSALQEKIAMMGQPVGNQSSDQARERQRVFEQHARIITHALKSDNAEKFKKGSIIRHAEVMCRVLKPLRCKSVEEDKAMRNLQLLAEIAWEISSKVWMSGMTLNYQFTQCGNVFTLNTMDALNSAPLGLSHKELQVARLRVSFVVTPMLTVRDERWEGEDVTVHGVKKAGKNEKRRKT